MKFNYQARDARGQTQIGVVEASSKDAALEVLSRQGFYITVLEKAQDKPFYARRVSLFDKVPQKEVMLFSRQLSILFQSQVTLVEALRTLATQTRHQLFKEELLEMSEDVEGGTSFSQALAKHPDTFSSYYISMAKSGESSGTLSKILDSLADHLEREYELSKKVKGALTYPAFVVVIGIAVMFLMMFFVIPNLTKVLTEFHTQLPLPTRIVIWIGNTLRSWWYVLFAAIGLGSFFLVRYLRTQEGKTVAGTFVLKIPFVGSLLSMVYLSRFAENLSTLVSGGLPIMQALEITRDIVGNTVYQRIIEEAKEAVSGGDTISDVLKKYPNQFPPLFTQMVQVGEKSGTLDSTLLHIVQFYEREVSGAVEGLVNILEPLLIVVLGALVGGLMAAILLPLYQISFS